MSAVRWFELFLNYGCQAGCAFCFNPPEADREEVYGIPFDRVARDLFRAKDRGMNALKLIGGEPTLRPDLPKIVRLAKKLGFERIQLTTNGIRLQEPGISEELFEAGIGEFRFSLHGGRAEVHDRAVDFHGAFHAATLGLESVKALGGRIGINTVIDRRNLDALEETLDFFYDRLRISDILVYFVRHQGYMALEKNREALELRMSEAAPVLERALKRLQRAGKDPLPFVFHMPPCQIPDFREQFLDWSTEDPAYRSQNAPENEVEHPRGGVEPVEAVTHRGKRRVEACSGCALESACLGVESSYLARFGSEEIRPLKGAVVS